MTPFRFCSIVAAALATLVSLPAKPLAEVYKIEDIALPKDVPPEVGALVFDSQGTLYVALSTIATGWPCRSRAGS
jgi:hypothetical protein